MSLVDGLNGWEVVGLAAAGIGALVLLLVVLSRLEKRRARVVEQAKPAH